MATETDLTRAYTALAAKASAYNTLWQYYDGDQPLLYSSQRLREVFRNLDARFVQNWCSVVIDAALDRLNLTGFQVANNEPATQALNAAFVETQLNLDSDDAHLAALVCGESFIIGWQNDDGAVEAFYNDPRLCHVQYNAANPLKKDWAAKWWVDDDGTYRLTLYYPDRLEYYATAKKSSQVSSAKAFGSADPPAAENPFGIIPVFHLRRERRKVVSELANAMGPQDAVNKLLADMMVAAEFGAFRQRYIIAQDDPGNLKNAPNLIWWIPAGDGQGQAASVGEFGQVDLTVYLAAMDKLATSIAVITRTPKHYFIAQGGDPSGEALIAMEAPLNKKCSRYIERFTATWRQVGAFLLQLLGYQDVPLAAIEPQFDRPETVLPRTQAEMQQMRVSSGEPLISVWRDQGKSLAQLEQLQADKAAEQAAATTGLAQALLEQQRRAEQQPPG